MKPIHQDDPILTAYVLGETTPAETQRVQAAAESNPEISDALDSAAEFSEFLEDSLVSTNNYRLSSTQLEEIRTHGQTESNLVKSKRPQRLNKTRLVTLLTSAAAVITVGVLVLHNTPTASSSGSHLSQNEAASPILTELHIKIVNPLLQKPWSSSAENQLTRLAGSIRGNKLLPMAPPRSQQTGLHELAQLGDPSQTREGMKADQPIADEAQLTLLAILQSDPDRFFQIMEAVAEKGELPSAGNLPNLVENVRLSASRSSQVPLTAGVASYPWLERFLVEKKELPPQSAIRIEELINHLDDYNLASQSGSSSSIESHGLRLTTELATCPWNASCLLAAIQITNQNTTQSATTAPLIRFRPIPESLGSYRLIGYASEANQENAPQSPQSDFSGISMPATLAAGASTIVLYEIQPTGANGSHLFSLDLMTHVDEGQPADVPLTSLNVHSNAPRWEDASADYQLATLIAASGLHLRDSVHIPDLSKADLISRVEALLDQNTLKTEQMKTLQLLHQALQLK